MRKGNDPTFHLDKKGDIFAIATGSDACSEHENGSKKMQSSLCGGLQGSNDEAVIAKFKKHSQTSFLDKLITKKDFVYPDLLERKRINLNPQNIKFIKSVEKGVECAAIIFGRDYKSNIPRELDHYSDNTCTGAWDESSFGFKVVGSKLVEKIEKFHASMVTNDAIFAGTFLENLNNKHLSGVIIALESKLRPEHRQDIKTAQRKYEENIRLKAFSREPEFTAIFRAADKDKKYIKLPGFIWPVWKDNVVDSEVLYAINPFDSEAQRLIPYWGPYTFDAIKDWMMAEKKYVLIPYQKETSDESQPRMRC